KLSVGAGPTAGNIERNGTPVDLTTSTSLRAGLHPLQLLDHASERAFDVGAGYGVDLLYGHSEVPGYRRTAAHGPYVEADYYPLRGRAGGVMFRWGGRAVADLLFLEPNVRKNVGAGGMLATEVELSGDADGAFADAGSDGAAIGAARGQWSVGAFVGGAMRE